MLQDICTYTRVQIKAANVTMQITMAATTMSSARSLCALVLLGMLLTSHASPSKLTGKPISPIPTPAPSPTNACNQGNLVMGCKHIVHNDEGSPDSPGMATCDYELDKDANENKNVQETYHVESVSLTEKYTATLLGWELHLEICAWCQPVG